MFYNQLKRELGATEEHDECVTDTPVNCVQTVTAEKGARRRRVQRCAWKAASPAYWYSMSKQSGAAEFGNALGKLPCRLRGRRLGAEPHTRSRFTSTNATSRN